MQHSHENLVTSADKMCFVVGSKRKQEILAALRRIHSATGHCSKEYLIKALIRRNACEETLEEHGKTQPRNQTNLEDLPPK